MVPKRFFENPAQVTLHAAASVTCGRVVDLRKIPRRHSYQPLNVVLGGLLDHMVSWCILRHIVDPFNSPELFSLACELEWSPLLLPENFPKCPP